MYMKTLLLALLCSSATVSASHTVQMGGMVMTYGGNSTGNLSLFCFGSGTPMLNGFQNARDENFCMLFLFPGSAVDDGVKYSFAIMGGFLLGLLNEILVIMRKRVAAYFAGKGQRTLRIWSLTCLYGLQMVTAYFCMLLVMLYENTLFSFIILGLVVGHFIHIIDSDTAKRSDATTDSAPVAEASLGAPSPASLGDACGTPLRWMLQTLLWVLPRACWLVFLIIILVWDEKVEGAFGRDATNLFSWHALCMTLAFPVLLSEAILLFSAPLLQPLYLTRHAGRREFILKFTHVFLHLLTFILTILGMIAIAYYKAESGMSNAFPFFTLYSPHSWLGLAVLVLWVLQLLTKALASVYCSDEASQSLVKRVHLFFGHAIYVLSLVTCALGLQDMQSSDLAGAGYAQDSMFAQLACAGVVMLMFLGVAVYLVPEVRQLLRSLAVKQTVEMTELT